MLRCPNCGREYPEGTNFCEDCGTPLVPQHTGSWDISSQQPTGSIDNSFDQAVKTWENTVGQSAGNQGNMYGQPGGSQGNSYGQPGGNRGSGYGQPAPKPPKKKKPVPKKNSSKKNILIAAIILVVLATVGICIWILSRPKADETTASSATSVSAESQTAANSTSGTSDSTSVSKPDDKDSSGTSEDSASSSSKDDEKLTATPTPTRKPIADTTTKSSVSASDITASLVSKSAVNLNGYAKVTVSSSGETSSIVQEGHNNKAEVAVDGQEVTSWQEGVAGDGIGEGIWFNLDRSYEIKYLSFKLGNWRDQKNYTENNRPSKLKISVGDFVTYIDFPNTKDEFYVALSDDYSASVVDIRVEGVYKGTAWDDTCIAEIGIYGK